MQFTKSKMFIYISYISQVDPFPSKLQCKTPKKQALLVRNGYRDLIHHFENPMVQCFKTCVPQVKNKNYYPQPLFKKPFA